MKTAITVFLIAGCLLLVFTPAGSDADKLPGTIMIDYLKDKYSGVEFDHQMHTYMSTESCGQCHHRHQRVGNLDCNGCHEIDASKFKSTAVSSFIRCSSCHGTYDPDNPEQPGLKVALHKTCFECHVGIGMLGQSPEGCAEKCHERN